MTATVAVKVRDTCAGVPVCGREVWCRMRVQEVRASAPLATPSSSVTSSGAKRVLSALSCRKAARPSPVMAYSASSVISVVPSQPRMRSFARRPCCRPASRSETAEMLYIGGGAYTSALHAACIPTRRSARGFAHCLGRGVGALVLPLERRPMIDR